MGGWTTDESFARLPATSRPARRTCGRAVSPGGIRTGQSSRSGGPYLPARPFFWQPEHPRPSAQPLFWQPRHPWLTAQPFFWQPGHRWPSAQPSFGQPGHPWLTEQPFFGQPVHRWPSARPSFSPNRLPRLTAQPLCACPATKSLTDQCASLNSTQERLGIIPMLDGEILHMFLRLEIPATSIPIQLPQHPRSIAP